MCVFLSFGLVSTIIVEKFRILGFFFFFYLYKIFHIHFSIILDRNVFSDKLWTF